MKAMRMFPLALSTLLVLVAGVDGLKSVNPSLDHRYLQDSSGDELPVPTEPAASPTIPPEDPSEDPGVGKGKGKGSSDDSDSDEDDNEPPEAGKGKGKGKGSKSSKKSSKKDSKSSKQSKSSKGKGGGKGSGTPAPSGNGGPPSVSPPSGSSKSAKTPSTRPPINISQPSSPPAAVPPTMLQAVELSTFAIAYTIETNSMPSRGDYLAVVELTDPYLEEYMIARWQSSTQAELVRMETTSSANFFSFGQPAVIEFEATAYFTQDSEVLPRPQVLASVLGQALDDPEPYIDALSALGSGNAFSTTTAVEFTEPPSNLAGTATKSAKSASSSSNAATIAAGAAGLALLMAGVVLYRRGRDGEKETRYGDKSFSKDGNDTATLAGDTYCDETYAGETYAGESYDQGMTTRRSAYLDRGDPSMVNVDLEGQEGSDASSVAPTWGDEESERSRDGSLKKTASSDSKDSRYLDEPVRGSSSSNVDDEVDDDSDKPKTTAQSHTGESSQEPSASSHESLSSSISQATGEKKPFSIDDFDAFLEERSSSNSSSSYGSLRDIEELKSKSWESNSSGKAEERLSSNRPLSLAEIETLLESDF